jgi:hypothetical protein
MGVSSRIQPERTMVSEGGRFYHCWDMTAGKKIHEQSRLEFTWLV